MPKLINIKKGDKYGFLTLTGNDLFKREGKRNDRVRYVECICDCGNIIRTRLCGLKNGNTKSCGCYQLSQSIKYASEHNKTHGDSGTKFYKKYKSICSRCNNKNQKSYKQYGGRGIKCLWNKYEDFKKDMYDSYIEHCKQYGEKNTTIDRIDVNGNYCKENCRWATYKEQANNTTKNSIFFYKGKKYTLQQLSEMAKIKRGTLYHRLKKGQDLETALYDHLHVNQFR